MRAAELTQGLSHARLVGQHIKAMSTLSLTPMRESVVRSTDALKGN